MNIRKLIDGKFEEFPAGEPISGKVPDGGKLMAELVEINGVFRPIVFQTIIERDGKDVQLGKVKARKMAVEDGNYAQFRSLKDAENYLLV